jgi:hypothetical protein
MANFRQILGDHNLEIAENYLNLHSIDIIRKPYTAQKTPPFSAANSSALSARREPPSS